MSCSHNRFRSALLGFRRILFVGEGVRLTHVVRPAVLARWARDAGYEVVFACSKRYAKIVQLECFTPVNLLSISSTDLSGRLATGFPCYTPEALIDCVGAEQAVIRDVRPDLVVGDSRPSLAISAALCGVQSLSLAGAHWSPAAGCPSGKGIWERLSRTVAQRLVSISEPLIRRHLGSVSDAMRLSHALSTLPGRGADYCAGDWCAYLDLPDLIPVDKPPNGHFYLGPVLWYPHGMSSFGLGALGGERALIYVGMSPSSDHGQLRGLLRAILDVGCDMVVSGLAQAQSQALEQEMPRLRGRSVFQEMLEPRLVLQRAAVTVCHGGSGTIYQSLDHGVPVLCMPCDSEQLAMSTALQGANAGLVCDPGRVAEQLWELTKGRCKSGARRLCLAVHNSGARQRWLRFLSAGTDRSVAIASRTLGHMTATMR